MRFCFHNQLVVNFEKYKWALLQESFTIHEWLLPIVTASRAIFERASVEKHLRMNFWYFWYLGGTYHAALLHASHYTHVPGLLFVCFGGEALPTSASLHSSSDWVTVASSLMCQWHLQDAEAQLPYLAAAQHANCAWLNHASVVLQDTSRMHGRL